MVMQFCQGFFKRPCMPPRFGIDKGLTPKATPKPSCMSSPAPSSVQVGESAAKVSQRAAMGQEQSPSLGAQNRQRTRHESRDPSKKTSLAKKIKSKGDSQLGKESDGDQPKKQAAAPTKVVSKGGFDAHRGPQDDEQAGPSHRAQGGWPTLQQSAATAGHKCAAAPSQSPKKSDAKVAWQIQAQHKIQQQALQPAPAHIFLPSVPVGTPKPFEMIKKSLMVGMMNGSI